MQTYKRHKPVHTPYIPVEIWGFIIELSCYNRGHKYTMFVSWEWFDMTIRSLSNLGMLATRSSALIDLIAKRTALKGLRMTMIGPTQDMIRPEMRLAALKIKTTPGQRDIAMDQMTSLEELNVQTRPNNEYSVLGVPKLHGLRKLTVHEWREDRSHENMGLAVLTSLTHLEFRGSRITDEIVHNICAMTQLESIVITRFHSGAHFVLGEWLRSMVNLKTLVIHVGFVGHEHGDIDVLAGMSGLTKLMLIGVSSDAIVRLPRSLEYISISGMLNAELSGCSRLLKLHVCGDGTYLDSIIASARDITTLKYLKVSAELGSSSLQAISAICGLESLKLGCCVALPNGFANLKKLRHLSIEFDSQCNSSFLRDITGLKSLKVEMPPMADDVIENIGLMTNLCKLHIVACCVLDFYFRLTPLTRLVNLTHLTIDYEWSDIGSTLEHLSMLTNMKSLSLLAPSYMTDSHLSCISKAMTLEELFIYGTGVTSKEISERLNGMPMLKDVRARGKPLKQGHVDLL
jgi:hypothetical protein